MLRSITIFETMEARSSPETSYLRFDLGLSQRLHMGAVLIRPSLTGSVTALHQTDFGETGADRMGIGGVGSTQLIATVTPEMLVGIDLSQGENHSASLSFTAAADLHSAERVQMPFRLLGANPGARPAVIGSALNWPGLRLGADLRVADRDRFQMRLNYALERGDQVQGQRFSVNFSYRF